MGLYRTARASRRTSTYSIFLVDVSVQRGIVPDKIFLLDHQHD
jgi:hypothetical protein